MMTGHCARHLFNHVITGYATVLSVVPVLINGTRGPANMSGTLYSPNLTSIVKYVTFI